MGRQRVQTTFVKWFGALFWVGLTACAAEEGKSAPGSLLEVDIPENFTFATSRGLRVRAEGSATAIADTLAELRLVSGEMVYRGPLVSAVELAIPTAADRLHVTLRTAQNERQLEVPVTGADIVLAVE